MKKIFCLLKKNSFVLFLLSSVFSVFVACSDMGNSDDAAERKAEGKAQISLSVNKAASRTIMPTNLKAEDIVKIVLTAEKLNSETKKYEDYAFDGESDKTWTTLTTEGETSSSSETAYSKMIADTLTLDYGTYNFSLDLYSYYSSDDTRERISQTGNRSAVEISENTKTLEFTTEYVEKGQLSLKLQWDFVNEDGAENSPIKNVQVNLYSIEESGDIGEALEGYEETISYSRTEIEDSSTEGGTKAVCLATYAPETEIPNGTYYITFTIYDDLDSILNTITDIVKIKGYKTEKTIKLDLSKIDIHYTVTYELNGGEWASTFKDDELLPYRSAYQFIPLPTKDDVLRAGYVFAGWYSDKDCTDGNEIEMIGAGEEYAKDYILYAKWEVVQLSPASGSIITDNGALTISVDKTEFPYLNNGTINFSATNSAGANVTDGVTYTAELLYGGGESLDTSYSTVDSEAGTISLLSEKPLLKRPSYQLYVTASQTLNSTTITSSATFMVTVGSKCLYTVSENSSLFTTLASVCEKITNSSLDYIIAVDGTLTGAQTIEASAAKSITLTGSAGDSSDKLNGNASGTTLTISTTVPVTITNLTITGGSATNGGGINIASGATVTLADGAVVAGNTAGTEKGCLGGGVYNEGTLFMYGSAVIGDASATSYATSAETSSNSALYGGGLYNASGAKAYLGYSDESIKAELTGGIFHNYAEDGGGAIFNAAELHINSGSLNYNYTPAWGGAIRTAGDTDGNSVITFSGGTISHNATNNNMGGGVILRGGTFTMTGGEISDNTAGKGGGISITDAAFTMTGGSIKGNTSDNLYYERGNGCTIGGKAVSAEDTITDDIIDAVISTADVSELLALESAEIHIEINYGDGTYVTLLNFTKKGDTFTYTTGEMFADGGATLVQDGDTLTLHVVPMNDDADDEYNLVVNTASNTYTVDNDSTYDEKITLKSWQINGTDISGNWTKDTSSRF